MVNAKKKEHVFAPASGRLYPMRVNSTFDETFTLLLAFIVDTLLLLLVTWMTMVAASSETTVKPIASEDVIARKVKCSP
jgi:hypothetical protein